MQNESQHLVVDATRFGRALSQIGRGGQSERSDLGMLTHRERLALCAFAPWREVNCSAADAGAIWGCSSQARCQTLPVRPNLPAFPPFLAVPWAPVVSKKCKVTIVTRPMLGMIVEGPVRSGSA
jgi:hypothetical protein